jgi:proteasome lid subunit RPN8/RPN11
VLNAVVAATRPRHRYLQSADKRLEYQIEPRGSDLRVALHWRSMLKAGGFGKARLAALSERDRFELDPADWVRADDAARADGLDIVGIWHSHPDHPAEPSETDRLAAHEGYSYLIVNVTRDGVGAMRSWRLAEQRFHEESLDP